MKKFIILIFTLLILITGCANFNNEAELDNSISEIVLYENDPSLQPITRELIHTFHKKNLKSQRKSLIATSARPQKWSMHAIASINLLENCLNNMKPLAIEKNEIATALFAINYAVHGMNRAGLETETAHLILLHKALEARSSDGDTPGQGILETYVHIAERTKINIARINAGMKSLSYNEL